MQKRPFSSFARRNTGNPRANNNRGRDQKGPRTNGIVDVLRMFCIPRVDGSIITIDPDTIRGDGVTQVLSAYPLQPQVGPLPDMVECVVARADPAGKFMMPDAKSPNGVRLFAHVALAAGAEKLVAWRFVGVDTIMGLYTVKSGDPSLTHELLKSYGANGIFAHDGAAEEYILASQDDKSPDKKSMKIDAVLSRQVLRHAQAVNALEGAGGTTLKSFFASLSIAVTGIRFSLPIILTMNGNKLLGAQGLAALHFMMRQRLTSAQQFQVGADGKVTLSGTVMNVDAVLKHYEAQRVKDQQMRQWKKMFPNATIESLEKLARFDKPEDLLRAVEDDTEGEE